MANFYWTFTAGGWIARLALHIGSGLGRWSSTVLKALQYSRLVSELNGLPGTHVDQAAQRRSDIPKHARWLVSGKD